MDNKLPRSAVGVVRVGDNVRGNALKKGTVQRMVFFIFFFVLSIAYTLKVILFL